MIDKENLKLSPYEYLIKNRVSAKGVAIITDKQYIYYSRVKDTDPVSHNGIIEAIRKEIAPIKPRGRGDHNLYICLDPLVTVIELPQDGKLSNFQFERLLSFIKDISKYNHEQEKKRRIPISIMPWNGYYFDEIYDLSDLRGENLTTLRKAITKNIPSSNEKIIGKSSLKSELESMFRIDLKNKENEKKTK